MSTASTARVTARQRHGREREAAAHAQPRNQGTRERPPGTRTQSAAPDLPSIQGRGMQCPYERRRESMRGKERHTCRTERKQAGSRRKGGRQGNPAFSIVLTGSFSCLVSFSLSRSMQVNRAGETVKERKEEGREIRPGKTKDHKRDMHTTHSRTKHREREQKHGGMLVVST